jgi:hypothetical protein
LGKRAPHRAASGNAPRIAKRSAKICCQILGKHDLDTRFAANFNSLLKPLVKKGRIYIIASQN